MDLLEMDPSEIENMFESKKEQIFKSDIETKTITAENYDYSLTLRVEDIVDKKDQYKFIKSCEHMIRSSPEYKLWVQYIREVMGIQECEITGEIHDQTKSEIHHHPFSLFIIVKAVLNKHMASNKKFCSFDIALEAIQLHYEMRVPFISLLKSIHEKFTNGYLKIPMEFVHGDHTYFLNNYAEYLDEEDLNPIYERLKVTKENCGWKEGYKWIVPTNGE